MKKIKKSRSHRGSFKKSQNGFNFASHASENFLRNTEENFSNFDEEQKNYVEGLNPNFVKKKKKVRFDPRYMSDTGINGKYNTGMVRRSHQQTKEENNSPYVRQCPEGCGRK